MATQLKYWIGHAESTDQSIKRLDIVWFDWLRFVIFKQLCEVDSLVIHQLLAWWALSSDPSMQMASRWIARKYPLKKQ